MFFEAYYLYLDKSCGIDPYASRYELDYARHMLQVVLGWSVANNLDLYAAQNLHWQTSNNARNGGDFGALARFELRWKPIEFSKHSVALGVDNF